MFTIILLWSLLGLKLSLVCLITEGRSFIASFVGLRIEKFFFFQKVGIL